ncbi:WD repeat-containing protein WRAP73 isoform X5 [Physeter macrocephalus]|uniref:WD repeat-containing protein WRAP73 isoform X5 n=1 Tax=Physeter macrocephalus TaxID=9755 RepID=A0A455B4L9_PHYMC|nr:WD repeat-containing protein WRAP73 isoform X5 [Physeter catodon]|eukprot:XP_028343747.1 WD repeat-containing protein WRAP73 isoform X2 [Physeter catodon]
MNFSEVFKLSSLLCKFSPDGKYLASCVQYRLVVRDANTLQIRQLYTCLDQIQHIEWSADSLFILCALYKRGLVQVWSLEQPEWHCKIDEGSAGLVASCWSPDGRHILNTTEFHLRITVWSLCTKSVSYIKYPKACQQGVTFTRDGRYLALAERRDCKDYVSILVCSDWQLLRKTFSISSLPAARLGKHFDTDTQDLAGIEWAPNGCVLAAWDSCLEYKILLYSLDGRLLSTFCAYEWSLGIKSVAWSPSSQFLAVGSYDGKVRILNHVTWKMITEFGHPATINNPKIVVYKEAEKSPPLVLGRLAFPPPRAAAGPLSSTESKYEVASVPVSLQTLKPAADRANPRIGVGALAFSPDSCFLATRSDSVPTAVWIWDIQKLRLLAVLEQLSAVRCFQWDPRQARLAICTGGSKVYLWSPAGCVSVQVPGEARTTSACASWRRSRGSAQPSGRGLTTRRTRARSGPRGSRPETSACVGRGKGAERLGAGSPTGVARRKCFACFSIARQFCEYVWYKTNFCYLK